MHTVSGEFASRSDTPLALPQREPPPRNVTARKWPGCGSSPGHRTGRHALRRRLPGSVQHRQRCQRKPNCALVAPGHRFHCEIPFLEERRMAGTCTPNQGTGRHHQTRPAPRLDLSLKRKGVKRPYRCRSTDNASHLITAVQRMTHSNSRASRSHLVVRLFLHLEGVRDLRKPALRPFRPTTIRSCWQKPDQVRFVTRNRFRSWKYATSARTQTRSARPPSRARKSDEPHRNS